MVRYLALIVLTFALAVAAAAQGPRGNDCAPEMEGRMRRMMRGPGMGLGPGMGKWWMNPAMVQKLALADAQVQQIEKVFQEHRSQLLDLGSALEKQEAALEPLITADHLNEGQIAVQIDKIAQTRANLEKSNSMMLLAMRRVLTVDQWKQLQSQRMGPRGALGAASPGR